MIRKDGDDRCINKQFYRLNVFCDVYALHQDDTPTPTHVRRKSKRNGPLTIADCEPGDTITIVARLGNFSRGVDTVWCRDASGVNGDAGPFPLSKDWICSKVATGDNK